MKNGFSTFCCAVTESLLVFHPVKMTLLLKICDWVLVFFHLWSKVTWAVNAHYKIQDAAYKHGQKVGRQRTSGRARCCHIPFYPIHVRTDVNRLSAGENTSMTGSPGHALSQPSARSVVATSGRCLPEFFCQDFVFWSRGFFPNNNAAPDAPLPTCCFPCGG